MGIFDCGWKQKLFPDVVEKVAKTAIQSEQEGFLSYECPLRVTIHLLPGKKGDKNKAQSC